MTYYPDTITVEIDSEVQSLVPEFLEKRKRDCLLIGSLLEADSFGEIRAVGHRMKGAGGSFGFDDISAIGEIIENAALAGDGKTIAGQIRRLTDYLEKVTVVYVDDLF